MLNAKRIMELFLISTKGFMVIMFTYVAMTYSLYL